MSQTRSAGATWSAAHSRETLLPTRLPLRRALPHHTGLLRLSWLHDILLGRFYCSLPEGRHVRNPPPPARLLLLALAWETTLGGRLGEPPLSFGIRAVVTSPTTSTTNGQKTATNSRQLGPGGGG
ncbi:unnamed protein product [Pleuronectes platessa]|uniref:Uncharacterized protein n=1 Tax=Pleuronectes platessa TaxID=8262 RepID=A0A9N7VZ04_PLEPL|nr:unnamed protein product [Pleuronectes platessa]